MPKPATGNRSEAEQWNEAEFVLQTVWGARGEIGDFTKLYREIQYVNGLVELLHQALVADERDTCNSDMNVSAVLAVLADARRRLPEVCSAAYQLSRLDQENET